MGTQAPSDDGNLIRHTTEDDEIIARYVLGVPIQ
jgi:hypothetical protein